MPDQLITLQQRLTLNDADGTPVASGTVTFYETGTTTRVDIYADPDYSTPLPNPLQADSSGRIVSVYYNGSAIVDAVIRTATGAFVDRLEQIAKFSTDSSGAEAITFSPVPTNDKTNVQEAVAYASEQAAAAASQTIPISRGGTGATTKATARSNLGLGNIATTDIIDEDNFSTNSASRAPSQQSVKAYVDSSVFGLGQAWTDVSGSRSAGSSYTNSTGKPIAVFIMSDGTSERYIEVSSNGGSSWVKASFADNDTKGSMEAIVPDGHRYRLTSANTIYEWNELR